MGRAFQPGGILGFGMGTDLRVCRFVEWQPSAINLCTASPTNPNQVAIVRARSGLELWTCLEGKMHMLGGFVGGPKTVESLAWSPSGRLFSVGLEGSVVEWDVEGRCARRLSDTHGAGPAWFCAVSPDGLLLAVGCENGSVRLFEIASASGKEQLKYVRNCELPGNGRVLALAWSPNGSQLAAGTASGSIFCISPSTLRILHTIPVEPTTIRDAQNNRQKKDTLVWALAFTSTDDLWSADSAGRLHLWSTVTGTLQQRYPISEADLFTLAVVGGSLFVAGAEQKIFELRQTPGSEQWFVVGALHRAHTHDIRCITGIAGDSLLSGSVDTSTALYRLDAKSRVKAPLRVLATPSPTQARIIGSRLWANEGSCIRVWDFSSAQPAPKQLLQLSMPADQEILEFAVSEAGWLALRMTGGSVKVFSYSFQAGEAGSVVDVGLDEAKCPHTSVMAIALNQTQLVCVVSRPKQNASLSVFNCEQDADGIYLSDGDQIDLPVRTVESAHLFDQTLMLVEGKELFSVNLKNKKVQEQMDLPSSIKQILQVGESQYALLADKDVLLLETGKKLALVEWPKVLRTQLSTVLNAKHTLPFIGMSFDMALSKLFLYSSDQVISVLVKAPISNVNSTTAAKLRRSTRRTKASTAAVNDTDHEQEETQQDAVLVKSARIVSEAIFAGPLPDHSLVVVERPLDAVLAALPSVVQRKLFGGLN